MAFSASTLSTQLQGLGTSPTEAAAITKLVAAWKTYFSAGGPGVTYTANPAHDSAMAAALVGMNAPNGFALKMQAGITAWWTAIVSTGPATYSGCTLVTPPALVTGIAALLTPVLVANVAAHPPLTKAQSCDAIAAVLHTNNLGGTATFPPAVVTPIV